MRERRIELGLTQQDLTGLLKVTYQQAYKYEKGINRLAAGRLYALAKALGVRVGYFFESLERTHQARTTQQRQLLELTQHFISLPRPQQEALCELARALVATTEDG